MNLARIYIVNPDGNYAEICRWPDGVPQPLAILGQGCNRRVILPTVTGSRAEGVTTNTPSHAAGFVRGFLAGCLLAVTAAIVALLIFGH